MDNYDEVQHPEFTLEKERLNQVIAKIAQDYGQTREHIFKGGNEWATKVLAHDRKRELQALRHLLQNHAYFGRIDFRESETQPVEEIYIGYKFIELKDYVICDWRSPIGKLFYSGSSKTHVYESPSGEISVNLLLKRHLAIQNHELKQISDEIDRRNSDDDIEPDALQNVFLLQQLSAKAEPLLREIIRTIQKEQDILIRLPASKMLVINGVAGSGKTMIAYHRLAYLLYPHHKSKVNSSNAIIFVPNQLFRDYTKELLPSLGEHSLVDTFEDWALTQMGLKGNNRILGRKIKHTIFDKIFSSTSLENNEQTLVDFAKIKGSLKMKNLLEAFVNFRKNFISIAENGIAFDEDINKFIPKHLVKDQNNAKPNKVKIFLDKDEILADHKYFANQTDNFSKQRGQLKELLVRKIITKIEESFIDKGIYGAYGLKAIELMLRNIEQFVSRNVNKKIEKWWPKINLFKDYYRLLNDRKFVQQLSQDFLPDELDKFPSGKKRGNNDIELEDLPALFYLHILASGISQIVYEHIVIDEAQDWSPLQFYIIKLYSSKDSITAVGDISQGIYSYKGLSSWDEIKLIFNNFHYADVTQNYRSTLPIVLFANQVLKKIYSENKPIFAMPFSREGAKPLIDEAKDETSMFQRIAYDIQNLQEVNGIRNIAVIVKYPSDCKEVANILRNHSIVISEVISSKNSKFNYKGGVVVIPAFLVKGLEFQAVLILNVDETTYDTNSVYDATLFYVAVTRALHNLHLYFWGKMTSFLDYAIEFATLRSEMQKQTDAQLQTSRNRIAYDKLIKPNEYNVIKEDEFRERTAQKERTEHNVNNRIYDGTFRSSPMRDNYDEVSDAAYDDYYWD